jgi:hypothetical protein
VQRHVRVHRCLALLRGVLLSYPLVRPAPSPSELSPAVHLAQIDLSGIDASLPPQSSVAQLSSDYAGSSSGSVSFELLQDDQLSMADVLALLETPALGQVAAVIKHLQVFCASARRQATVSGLPTWDECTGTGDDSGATDCSDTESGVRMSTGSTDSARIDSAEFDPQVAEAIDEMEVYVNPSDAAASTADVTRAVRGPPTTSPSRTEEWVTGDAGAIGSRAMHALGLDAVSASAAHAIAAPDVDAASDAGDAVTFGDGVSVLLDYLAFTLLRGHRSLSLT